MKTTNTLEPALKSFHIRFTGCTKGAIGKFYKYSELVKAESEEKAIISLYYKYDHIHLIYINGIKYNPA